MLLMQVLEGQPPAARQRDNRVPREPDTICQKSFAKEPARRFQSAEALADGLQRWLKNEPIIARPVGRIERGWRWCQRNQALAGLAAAFIAAIVSGATISGYF